MSGDEVKNNKKYLLIVFGITLVGLEHIKKLVFEFGVSCKPLSIAS